MFIIFSFDIILKYKLIKKDETMVFERNCVQAGQPLLFQMELNFNTQKLMILWEIQTL